MNTLKTMIVGICVLLLSGLAVADDKETVVSPQITSEREMQTFKRLDTDNSGGISAEEAKSAGVKEFAKADKNSDGELDINEFVLLARAEAGKR